MKNEIIWFDRKFKFDLPLEYFPTIVDRLRGAPIRLNAKVATLPHDILTRQADNFWSAQEHAGHLLDLEPLWHKRILNFLNGDKDLYPADLENKKTKDANHNQKDISIILDSFNTERKKLIDKLEDLDSTQVGLTALHPRLKQPMRLIDSCFFIAEHDDHHLSKIQDLIK